jgi:hypothetical protein
VTGSGDVIALDPTQNNSFRFINRALKAGGALRIDTTDGTRYLVTGVDEAQSARWATELSLRAARTAASPTSVAAPTRIALYKGAPGNMDQGWTEWLLDTHEFQYTLIGPETLRAGALGARFDVIVLASQNLGRGRVDSALVAQVDAFVRDGGTVVAWNGGATSAASALQLPVRNVLQGVPRQTYFTGSSVMRTIVDRTHPVMAGMPDSADVMVNSSPVFTTTDGFTGSIIATYPTNGTLLRSGFLKGDSLMRGQAAALDVALGSGHVVLMAFQPQWRGQPMGTFRTVFNALFYARGAARPPQRPASR